MESQQSRRQHIRISKSLDIRYWIIKDILHYGSRSVDVSNGGIRFPVIQRLEPGTVLGLEIHLQDITRPIEATAEVVWQELRRHEKYPYEVGVKFIKIAHMDIEVLMTYCQGFVIPP
jgi:c-di-GMP-binding flagellar brake protein YcgR